MFVKVRTTLQMISLALMATLGVLATRAQTNPGAKPVRGILLLAHGGSKEWNSNVQAIAADVNKREPTEVALGMADRTTLQAGIDKLTARGAQEIIAVPLFVSSHSSVIECTRFLLGLRADAPAELAEFAGMHMDHDSMPGSGDPVTGVKPADQSLKTTPVKSALPIHMAAALDRHPTLADILSERATRISRNPLREVLVLVAHGPNDDQENELWLGDLRAVARLIAAKRSFARIEVTTIRDDADGPVREEATEKLRAIVSSAGDQNRHVLVVPVLLSYGGIENGIRKRLDGLDHIFSPAGLIPDPRISEWIISSAQGTEK